jgi:hypothetical protein
MVYGYDASVAKVLTAAPGIPVSSHEFAFLALHGAEVWPARD